MTETKEIEDMELEILPDIVKSFRRDMRRILDGYLDADVAFETMLADLGACAGEYFGRVGRSFSVACVFDRETLAAFGREVLDQSLWRPSGDRWRRVRSKDD
ncbi:MAG: hypothetical protein L0Z50_33695 [Verrucomicrobiales bacterium]|nr:hypothetical protein [Verrucomicrobiales bacterium]